MIANGLKILSISVKRHGQYKSACTTNSGHLINEMASYGTVEADCEPKPSYRETATMDPRSWVKDLTPYFMYLLLVATVGPLLFGFHLVHSILDPETIETG